MADHDSGIMLDYLEHSLRSIHKVNAWVNGPTLEMNVRLCRNIINHDLQDLQDFLMLNWEKLLVKDLVDDRRRVALLHLYAVVKQAEHLVHQCCQSNDTTWPERALSLHKMKEDVLDITLHLRWWTSVVHMVVESSLSQLPNSAATQHMELKCLERANQEFEETVSVMAMFDVMDDSSIDEGRKETVVKKRMPETLQRIQGLRGLAYHGAVGTKEHLEFILSWQYSERDHRAVPMNGTRFKYVLMRCIELQKSAAQDKQHLLNKALDVMGSPTGVNRDLDVVGSSTGVNKDLDVIGASSCVNREILDVMGVSHTGDYLLAHQVYSLLTNEEVDGVVLPELNEYKVMCTLGQGSFGVMWCGLDCVVKQSAVDNSSLRRFSHPHIVKFYRHFWATPSGDGNDLSPVSNMVMEGMLVDLAQHMKSLKEKYVNPSTSPMSLSSLSSSSSCVVPFSEPVAVDIMLQLAKAMWYMHSRHVVHGDLKPGNVFVRRVSERELPELFSQGYVKVKLGDMSPLVMSLYRAPEMLLPNSTTIEGVTVKNPHRADLWSFGVMSSEILTGEVPSFGKDGMTLLENIRRGARPWIPDECPDYLRFCIESCWKYEPLGRPRFSDIWRMLRIAKLRSLGLIHQNHDFFTFKDRMHHVVGMYTGSVLSRAKQMQLERTSNVVVRSTKSTKPRAHGNFSLLTSIFKFKMLGGPKLKPDQGPDIHFVSAHKQPFGCLTNKVWPREKVGDNWKLTVIFFEGNVGGRQKMSCRDTWLQRDHPKVFWPRDWLPQDVHNKRIRVLVLEYCISETGLEGLVSNIKKSLIFSDRWNHNHIWDHPIVLVGHSLGCTIIEALVSELEQNARLPYGDPTSDHDNIIRETARTFMCHLRGCFFYACPGYGLVKSHSFLKDIFGGLTYSNELFSKEFWEGSQKLQKRSADFLRITRAHNPQIRLMSMIEGGHTRGRFVVQRLFYPSEYNFSIDQNLVLEDSNHIEVCKPVDRDHPSYQELVQFLIRNTFTVIVDPPARLRYGTQSKDVKTEATSNDQVFIPDMNPGAIDNNDQVLILDVKTRTASNDQVLIPNVKIEATGNDQVFIPDV